MADHPNLRGRRAFVTGGSKGIGAAIVRRLRMQGAEVVLSAQDMPLAEQLAANSSLFVTDDRFHRNEHAVEVEVPLRKFTRNQ